jgi:hypothetical protein
MPGSQGSGPGAVGVSAVRRQSRTAAISSAVRRSRPAAVVSRWRSGCFPVSAAKLSRWARRVGQAGSSVSPGNVLTGLVELCDGLGSNELFGCDVEGVGVALDRLEEPGRWVVELAQHGAGGDRRFVAGEDLLQRLGRRAR